MLTRWAYFLRRLGIVLALYICLRGLFFACNYHRFSGFSAKDIATAFLQGLRFDLAAVAATNFLFILLTFLPWRLEPPPAWERLTKIVFLVLNAPFLVINVIDLEFFQFNGRRSTLELLGLAGDAAVQPLMVARYYWPLVLLGLALFAALFFLYGKAPASASIEVRRAPIPAWLLSLLCAVAFSIVAIRGGLQWKPLAPAEAMPGAPGDIGQLALNSSFTVLKSYNQRSLPRVHYFSNRNDLLQVLRPFVEGRKIIPDEPRRDNVVILVLESFAAEYMGAGNGGSRYTPFLDSLAGQALFFGQNYANGRRSIEAMPSILAGLPSLMPNPLLESIYQNNQLLGLGSLLTPLGYTCSFFHGAQNGTMRFDTFMSRAGIPHYFGLKEYPDRADSDGHWGILDEPYLQYVARELSRQKPPFAATVFTLSSHHPYAVPDKYRGRFKRGTLAIHESIGYTDFSIEQFFATARQQPWYSNTLFIITADHTQKLETPDYLNPLGEHRVPLLFFHPQSKFPGVDTNRVTEQVDILPSVLDYLKVQPDHRLLFGKSVFREGEGRAFLYDNGRYWLVRGQHALELTPGRESRLFDLAQDRQLKSPLPVGPGAAADLEREAKALVQYYNNGMIDNNLYDGIP
jgi:glucan phosphoethanolaminetransferase (alkaline phosphatase superfamily)